MIWSICWISRRTLHSVFLMISSIHQRLPWKICGLFDTGFAGDVDFITSPGLNASMDLPGNFGVDGQNSIPNLGSAGLKNDADHLKKVDEWDVLNDLDDLSDDPLGDDSMEAFINLDKFLNGNSFFDEDGNLTVSDDNNDLTLPNEEVEVKPVINLAPQTEDINSVPEILRMAPMPNTSAQSQTGKTSGKPSRKRPARAMGGVKTSLFEIPAAAGDGGSGSRSVAVGSEYDHDYSSKRQRVSSPAVNSSGTKTTVWTSESGKPVASTSDGPEPAVLFDDGMDKQTIRRIKNNHASKRSREQRKQKFVDMDLEAEELIEKNQKLREKIVELEKLAKDMKEILVAKMAGKCT